MHSTLKGRVTKYAGVLYCFALWRVFLALFIQICLYVNDVHTRWTKGANCTWHPVKSRFAIPKPPPHYVACYCNIEKYTVWLQLHDASGQTLLAERMYFDLDQGSFIWYSNPRGSGERSLIFDTSAEGRDAEIVIPPTLLNRLLAALP